MEIKSTSDVVKVLAKVKKSKKLTKEKIAFYGDLSKSTVGDFFEDRKNDYSLSTVLRIAEAMDCTVELRLVQKRSKVC